MNLDHLKQENEFCKDCRWNVNQICINTAQLEYFNIENEDIKKCDYKYHEDDRKVFSSEDLETENLFEELY